jgi:hypothetical protein
LLGFFYPLCPGFAFHFFNLPPPTDIIHPLISLKTYSPKLLLTSSPITYLGCIRVLSPTPHKLVHFLPKNIKVSQIYIKFISFPIFLN